MVLLSDLVWRSPYRSGSLGKPSFIAENEDKEWRGSMIENIKTIIQYLVVEGDGYVGGLEEDVLGRVREALFCS